MTNQHHRRRLLTTEPAEKTGWTFMPAVKTLCYFPLSNHRRYLFPHADKKKGIVLQILSGLLLNTFVEVQRTDGQMDGCFSVSPETICDQFAHGNYSEQWFRIREHRTVNTANMEVMPKARSHTAAAAAAATSTDSKNGNLSLCFYIDTLNRNSSQSTRTEQTRWARSTRPCSPGLVVSSRLWTVYERKTTDVHVWTSLHVRRRRGWSKRIHHTVLTFIKVTLRLWRQESNLFNKADMFGETSARLTRTLAMFLKCFKPNHDIFRTLNKWFLCHKQCIQN